MFLENRNNILKSLFSQCLPYHLAHHASSILAHWVELLCPKRQHFDIRVSAFVLICDMGMSKIHSS